MPDFRLRPLSTLPGKRVTRNSCQSATPATAEPFTNLIEVFELLPRRFADGSLPKVNVVYNRALMMRSGVTGALRVSPVKGRLPRTH